MLVTRFWRSTSGNFAMMFAVSLPVMLTGVGFALDVSNLMTAKSNLQNALDSAVLAASRLADKSTSRDDLFDGYFKANTSGQGNLVNPSAHLTVEQGVNYIKTTATATADVALNFSFVFGKNGHLSVKASAYESTAKLEVAMVLDNTGSMGDANMNALRDGAKQLVEILKGAKNEKPEREIRVALVPFVTAVNINGEGFFKEAWLDKRTRIPTTDNSFNGKNFDAADTKNRFGHWDLFLKLNPSYPTVRNANVDWKGCVEARPGPYNLDDTVPDATVPATLFVPYFAPDEPGSAAKASNADTAVFNNTYLGDVITSSDNKKLQSSTTKYSKITDKAANQVYITTAAPLTSGPNYACPTPIAPLTADLDKLKAEIDKMKYWNGSGTNVSEGLAWGYRVLSPRFSDGDAFNSQDTSKVVVVFTDGENNVFGQKNNFNGSDYGAYGYLSTGRLGSTERAKALTNVNTLTSTMCTNLKDKGVRVFTVVLGADTAANRTLYSGCASTPANYYPTKDATQLKAAFDNIAYAITDLYVTN
jgi:Flp pilus assembly protein TadG